MDPWKLKDFSDPVSWNFAPCNRGLSSVYELHIYTYYMR